MVTREAIEEVLLCLAPDTVNDCFIFPSWEYVLHADESQSYKKDMRLFAEDWFRVIDASMR